MPRILQTQPVMTAPFFTVCFSLESVPTLVTWMYSNLFAFGRGLFSSTDIILVLSVMAVMQLRSNRGGVEYNKYIDIVKSAGVPPFYQGISLMLPDYVVKFIEYVPINFTFLLVDESYVDTAVNNGSFMLALNSVNKYHAVNSSYTMNFQFGQSTKVYEPLVVCSERSTTAGQTIFPAEEGFQPSYHWLSFLTFKAHLIPAVPGGTAISIFNLEDFGRIFCLKHKAITISTQQMQQMQFQVWNWYFRGNLITTQRTNISKVDPKAPVFEHTVLEVPEIETGSYNKNKPSTEVISNNQRRKSNPKQGKASKDKSSSMDDKLNMLIKYVSSLAKLVKNGSGVILDPVLDMSFA